MKKVVIGSRNPIKLEATRVAFEKVFSGEAFEYIAFDANSGVPDQPLGIEETRLGAKNRSDEGRRHHPEGDYFVGIEGGVEEINGQYWASAWMCVQDGRGKQSYGRTGGFLLPEDITVLIKEGKDLGDATDIVLGTTDSKHGGGAIGALTRGIVTRKDYYIDAIVFALIPFIRPELYEA